MAKAGADDQYSMNYIVDTAQCARFNQNNGLTKLDIVFKEETGLEYDLVFVLSKDEMIVYSFRGHEAEGDRRNSSDIRYVSRLPCPTAVKRLDFISTWQVIVILTCSSELYSIPLNAVLATEGKKQQNERESRDVKVGEDRIVSPGEQNDVFSDLLNPRGLKKEVLKAEDNFHLLSRRNVIHFRRFSESMMFLSAEDGRVCIVYCVSTLSRTHENRYEENMLGVFSKVDSCTWVGMSSRFLIARSKTLPKKEGCQLFDNALLVGLNSSMACFSDSAVLLLGFETGKVYTAIISFTDESNFAKQGQQQRKDPSRELRCMNLFCHLHEAIQDILTCDVKVDEKDGESTLDAPNPDMRLPTERTIVVIIGRKGNVKLVYSDFYNSDLINITDEQTEGPIIDYVYDDLNQLLVTVCPLCINLQRLTLRKEMRNSSKLKRSRLKAKLELLSSFPITRVSSIKLLRESELGSKKQFLFILGINNSGQVFNLQVNLQDSLNLRSRSIAGASASDLLQKVKTIGDRKNIVAARVQLQNSALAKLNVVARIVCAFQQRPRNGGQSFFNCKVDFSLRKSRSPLSIQITFSNESVYALDHGWSLLTRIRFRGPLSKDRENLYISHMEALSFLTKNECHNYCIELAFFENCHFPLCLNFYLVYNRSSLVSDNSNKDTKDNCIFLHILSREVSFLEIQGSVKIASSMGQHSVLTTTDDLQAPNFEMVFDSKFLKLLDGANGSLSLGSSTEINRILTLLFPTLRVHELSGYLKVKGVKLEFWFGGSIIFRVQDTGSQKCTRDDDQGKERRVVLQFQSTSLATLSAFHSAFCHRLMDHLRKVEELDDGQIPWPPTKRTSEVVIGDIQIQDEIKEIRRGLNLSEMDSVQEAMSVQNRERLIKLFTKLRSVTFL